MARNGYIKTAGRPGDDHDSYVPGFDGRTPPGEYITDNPALWGSHNTDPPFYLRPSGRRIAPSDIASWRKVSANHFDVVLTDGGTGYVCHGAFETIMAGAQ